MHTRPYDGHMARRLAVFVLFAVAVTAHATEVLDNAAVIKLARAGLSSELILLKIEQSEARFDTSTDALVELKSAGLGDAAIKAMMLKAPAPATRPVTPPTLPAPAPAPPAAQGEVCAKLSLYALGNNGWAWVPASACVSATELSVDEQAFPFAQLTVHCLEPETRLSILGTTASGEATWRFSDGKESFALRGKADDLRKLSDALATAAPAVRHGKCSARELRALLPRSSS